MSTTTAYTVTGRPGKQRVNFTCGRCQAELASPLAEAGQRFPCPTCGSDLTTPGDKELRTAKRAAAAEQAEREAKAAAKLAGVKQQRIDPVAIAPTPQADRVVTSHAAIACDNCGRPIGRLERAIPYQGHTVCTECYARLAPTIDYASPAAAAIPVAHAERHTASAARACPACGSGRPAVKKAKGSTIVLIVLLLLWILPGILYLILYQGHIYVCPSCGYKYGDAS